MSTDSPNFSSPTPAEPGVAPRRRRWPWAIAAVLVFSIMVAGGAVAGATVSYAEAQQGRLLPGTTVGGVDVSGLTPEHALERVEAAAADELDRKVTVRWGARKWKTTPRRLGSVSNAPAVIDEIVGLQSGMTWQDWAEVRWLGRQANVAADVALRHNRSKVVRFANAIDSDVTRDPRNAKLNVVDNVVAIRSDRTGYAVQTAPLVRDLLVSLRKGRHQPIQAEVDRHKAEITEKAFSQVLLLDQSEHRLTLYLDGEEAESWIVATGTGQYPTPIGRYEVNLKRYMPTWVNPDPDGWGANMPASIPPGVNNPLGVRALNWSAPGAIRFHGTQAISSLGTSASHGCVRMSNTDVSQLYDMVDVGAVIISQY